MFNLKKSIAVVMTLLVLVTSVPFAAAEEPIPPDDHAFYEPAEGEEVGSRLNYIYNEEVKATNGSTGRINMRVSFDTDPYMMKLGFTVLTLQHWNGSQWEDVWSVTDQYDTYTNTFYYSTYKTGCISGDYYRVTCELYAKKGLFLVQKKTVTSSAVVCG